MLHKNLAFLVIVLFLSGCTGYTPRIPPFAHTYAPTYDALVYKGSRETLQVYDHNSGPSRRGGYVCNKSLLGLASWGSLSVDEAQRKGGIEKIHKVEMVRDEILNGIWGKQCIIVKGE